MALQTVRGSKNIPPGSVVVSRNEALDHQKTIVKNWEKESDVFFLKFGRHIATGMTAMSSILVCGFYRKIFRLKFVIPFTAIYVPVTGVPIVAVNYAFEKRVTENNLLLTLKCPMCAQIQYICGHLVSSVFYPGISSALLFSIIARLKSTVDAPSFNEKPKEFCQYIYKVTKPSALKIQGLIAFHFFIILFIQHMQVTEVSNLSKNILKKEKFNDNELEIS